MTFATALAGGIIIGLASALMHILLGRVAGISGIVGSLFAGRKAAEQGWRIAFLAGLLVAGAIWAMASSSSFSAPAGSTLQIIIAGLLVGFGARLGGGCTSGHGVCGMSRFSTRSMVATLCFVFTGVVTVALS